MDRYGSFLRSFGGGLGGGRNQKSLDTKTQEHHHHDEEEEAESHHPPRRSAHDGIDDDEPAGGEQGEGGGSSRFGSRSHDAHLTTESTSLLRRHRPAQQQPAAGLLPSVVPLAIEDDDDDDDVDAHFADHDPYRLRQRRRSNSSHGGAVGRWWAVTVSLSILATLMGVSLYETLPTSHELHLLSDYDLSYWDVPRLRSAQALALESASILEDADASYQDGHTVVHKITKHKSTSQKHAYMRPPEGCESTVVIVRHCEKGSVREHCAHVGFERAVYLSTLFGDHDNDRWPSPSFIFAEGPGQRRNQRKMNFREMETVGPLADKVGVKVDDSYSTETVNDLAREILTVLQSGQMCGKVTLISWKHSNIAHLAHRLGCGPEQGCPMDYKGSSYDMAWQVKFSYQRPEHSTQKDLQLSDEPLWNIAGSVQPEGFDPLAFSKRSGDYPEGGTSHGARWSQSAVSFPERKRKSHAQWKATRVGFHDNKKQSSDSGGGS